MKIVVAPSYGDAFGIAAQEMGKYYHQITGKLAAITDSIPPQDDAVCICPVGGSTLADQRVKDGSDEFAIVSVEDGDRTLLVITAGRGRAALYGVYAFLEKESSRLSLFLGRGCNPTSRQYPAGRLGYPRSAPLRVPRHPLFCP